MVFQCEVIWALTPVGHDSTTGLNLFLVVVTLSYLAGKLEELPKSEMQSIMKIQQPLQVERSVGQ